MFCKDLLCQLWGDLSIRTFLEYFKQWVLMFYFILCVMWISEGAEVFLYFSPIFLFETVYLSLRLVFIYAASWQACFRCLPLFFFPLLRLQLPFILMPDFYMGAKARTQILMFERRTLLLNYHSSPKTMNIQCRPIIPLAINNVKLIRKYWDSSVWSYHYT